MLLDGSPLVLAYVSIYADELLPETEIELIGATGEGGMTWPAGFPIWGSWQALGPCAASDQPNGNAIPFESISSFTVNPSIVSDGSRSYGAVKQLFRD